MSFDDVAFSTAFNKSPIGQIIFDDKLTLIQVNKGMFKCFNIKKKEFEGRRFGNAFDCLTIANSDELCGTTDKCELCELRNNLLKALKENIDITDFIANMIFKVGSSNVEKWFEISVNPIKYESKKYIIASFTDMTETKIKEKVLKDNQAKYKMLFENMTQGFALNEIITNVDGNPVDYRFIDVNPAFENLTGLKREDLIGKTVKEILPNTEQYWIDIYGKVAISGEPIKYENYSVEFDKYYESWVFCPQLGQFSVVFSDITERKSMENSLQENEKRFRSYIDNAPDGVFVTNKAGICKEVNNVACEMSGYSKEELIEKSVMKLIPNENNEDTAKAFGSLVEFGKLNIELPFINKNMEKRMLSINAVKINDDEYLGFIKDISEKTEFENRLKYYFYHDQLTDLYNRRYIFDNLSEMDHEKNYPLSIIFADINGLRSINEALGFNIGDEIIKKVAVVLKKECAPNDISARWSGDDFIVLLPNKCTEQAQELIKRLNSSLNEQNSKEIPISVAFGVATKNDNNETLKNAIRFAEEDMLKSKTYESTSIQNSSINMILQTLHEKNKREEMHSRRVSEICVAIGKAMNFSNEDINKLRIIGLVHDIGKIGIDEHILNKAGKLNNNECNEVKQHTEIGYRILSANDQTSELAFYVLSHHEKLDGTGYPNGIKGDSIVLFTRILSIADAFDAMTSKRAYRDGISHFEAAKELLRCSGTQFDEKIVEIFIDKALPNIIFN